MALCIFLPFLCPFLIAVFCPANAQFFECRRYEEEVECVDFCNTCDQDWPCLGGSCVPGCDCIPGFLRDDFGNCVPRHFCNNEFKGAIPKQNAVALSGGCPTPSYCVVSCKRRGFEDGICLGPKNEYCNCFSQKPPEKVPSKTTADDPGAIPKPNALALSGGCPTPSYCVVSCKRRGFEDGICLGPKNEYCNCFSQKPPEKVPS